MAKTPKSVALQTVSTSIAAMSHVLLRRLSSIIVELHAQLRKRRRVTPMSLYYKCVAVRQPEQIFLSSSPRWLSIRFFSKALVGEHRPLSFLHGMVMILTPHCSPDVRLLIASFSSYKYFQTCVLTRFSLFLLSRHLHFPPLCLPHWQLKNLARQSWMSHGYQPNHLPQFNNLPNNLLHFHHLPHIIPQLNKLIRLSHIGKEIYLSSLKALCDNWDY